jgi:hypothetical protein
MARSSNSNNALLNRVATADTAAHDWYRFVLSFPPHLVREYVQRFELTDTDCVLDSFCGTGTTNVECKKLGIPSIGIEAHPMAYFASKVKVAWDTNPEELKHHADQIAELTRERLAVKGIQDDEPLFSAPLGDSGLKIAALRTLPVSNAGILLKDSISPLPLHKTLALLDVINEFRDNRLYDHEMLALAKAIVTSISNLHFGPEVGVGRIKNDASVVGSWLRCIRGMCGDLLVLERYRQTPALIYKADARQLESLLQPASISAVITSPPYPNEKDYTRTTRLESVILGFIKNKEDLKELKRHLLRSNTRTVYKSDDDDRWIASHAEIQRIAQAIEDRRVQMGKTSGFERLYHRVTKLYFGGMALHFSQLRQALRPGAYLAYVVGDQASYLRVMIRTGQLLADVAKSLGFEVVGIDLFRTRLATATKEQLREEVVVLRWPSRAVYGVSTNAFGAAEPSQPYSSRRTSMSKRIASHAHLNRYTQIIERIFFQHYREGSTEAVFSREEIEKVAKELKIKLPKNLGDIIYSFRYRSSLPVSIRDKAPTDKEWIIRPAGRSKYCFALVTQQTILPNPMLSETKIPDSTPGLISMYALDDKQALLARLRYNRLVDIFTGISTYSLQSHLRTAVPEMGQVETDEVYIGVDKKGLHYVFPVQAKAGKDRINVVQIEQDLAMCAQKFPNLICRAVGAQFVQQDLIALFEFENTADGVKVVSEKHYRLVNPEEVTPELLKTYRDRLPKD